MNSLLRTFWLSVACLGTPLALFAQTWDGGGNSALWSTAKNWNTDVVPTFGASTSLIFAGNKRTSPDMNGNRTVNAITFASGASSFTLAGTATGNTETLTLAGTNPTLLQLSANNQSLVMNRLSLSAAGTITTTGTGSLTIGDGTAANGNLYGTGNITKTGAGGALVLKANNANWSGNLAINQGMVQALYSGSALGTGSTTVASGAGLQLGTGGLSFANNLFLSGDGPTGTGALRNVATTGTNTVSGAITLSADARLGADAGGALDLTGTVAAADKILTVDTTGTVSITGNLTGTVGSSLAKAGTGTLALSGGNSGFAGSVAVSAGTVLANAANVFNSANAITVNTGSILNLNDFNQTIAAIASSGTLALGVGTGDTLTLTAGASTLGGSLTGAGTIVIGAGATLTLGANFNAPNVNFTLAGGTLNLNGTTSSFGLLNITGNSVLDFGNSSASTVTVNDITFQNTGLALNISSWVGLTDYFYAQNFSGATPDLEGGAPQNQIVFADFSSTNSVWQSMDHQIVPVPEPATYGALIVAVSLALVVWRRRRRAV